MLNGGIFALWGAYDVGVGLASAEARSQFDSGLATLAETSGAGTPATGASDCLHTRPMLNLAGARGRTTCYTSDSCVPCS